MITGCQLALVTGLFFFLLKYVAPPPNFHRQLKRDMHFEFFYFKKIETQTFFILMKHTMVILYKTVTPMEFGIYLDYHNHHQK